MSTQPSYYVHDYRLAAFCSEPVCLSEQVNESGSLSNRPVNHSRRVLHIVEINTQTKLTDQSIVLLALKKRWTKKRVHSLLTNGTIRISKKMESQIHRDKDRSKDGK